MSAPVPGNVSQVLSNAAFPRILLSDYTALAASPYPSVSFLQTVFWGRFKEKFGWQAYVVSIEAEKPFHILILVRSVLRAWHFAYIPHGPNIERIQELSERLNQDVGKTLRNLSRGIVRALPKKCVFVRWDPDWIVSSRPALSPDDGETEEGGDTAGAVKTQSDTASGSDEPQRIEAGTSNQSPILNSMSPSLRKAASDVQPPHTVLIDISLSEERILADMKSKTRYNVRLAEKKGVVVTKAGPERLSEWYELYKETAERDRIAVHSFEYYMELFRENRDNMELLLANHESDLLAGIIVLYWGKRATYLYGASSNIKRNLMPAYALQWHAIRSAKARSCDSYDLFGLPSRADPGHPMFGLYQFKTGFGGNLVSYPGAWDYPANPLFYAMMEMAESVRHFYFKRLKKRR